MRKILIGIVVILVLAVAGVLIAPSLINWNNYKSEITAQAKQATGRRLTIAGDISLSIFPAPVVIINDVAFASVPGAKERQMVKLRSLEVRIALGPLISGNIQVEKIRLVNPVINLEVLKNGRKNWELDLPTTKPSSGSSSSSSSSDPSEGPGVQLNNFELVNASVTYRDSRSGLVETISKINGTFKMASLQGPFVSEGSLSVRNIPITYKVGVEGIYQGRTAPIKAEIKFRDTLLSAALSGKITNLNTTPKFRGKTHIKSSSLGDIIDAFAPGTKLPTELNQALDLKAAISATATNVDISDMELTMGDISANGRLKATVLSDAPPTSSVIPSNITANLSLKVNGITHQGGTIDAVNINAELNDGEITLSQLSARLPGTTDFGISGIASAPEGVLIFEGTSDLNIDNVREFTSWLGIDLGMINRNKLKSIKSTVSIKATKNEIQLRKIKVGFDKSRLSGAVTIAIRSKPGLGVLLKLDRLNLDEYVSKKSATSTGTTSSAQSTGQNNSPSTSTTSLNQQLTGLDALLRFDANTKISIGELIYNGTKFKKIIVDTTLIKNTLKLNDVNVGNLAGAKVSVSGAISKLNKLPEFNKLTLKFQAKSIALLAKTFDLKLPVPAKTIGKVTLITTLNGPILQPHIKADLQAMGAALLIDGKLSTLPTHPLVDVNVTFNHENLASLIKASGSDYRPSGNIGGIKVSTHVKASETKIAFSKLSGTLGRTKFTGSGIVENADTRPRLKVKLNAGEILVDPYVPASQSGSSSSTQTSSSTSPSAEPSSSGAPWSKAEIDVAALRNFDADLEIKSSAIQYGNIKLKDAIVLVNLDKGILNAKQVSGSLFGGQINLTSVLDARAVPNIKSTLSVSNMQISSLLSALSDQSMAAGTVLFKTNLDTRGSSVANMVSALNGGGSFDLKALDVQGSTQGTPLAGLLGIFGGLNQLGAGLTGQSTNSLADASGAFIIKNGIVDLRDTALFSGLGNGEVMGQVDLARWQLDITGVIHLAQNILAQVLSLNTGIISDFPFSVSGSIDDPTINFLTGSSSGNAPSLPIIGDVPVIGSVIESVLGGILGGQIQGQTQQQTPTTQPSSSGSATSGTPPPPPQQNQQQQPDQQIIKPEDLLKQLFKF